MGLFSKLSGNKDALHNRIAQTDKHLEAAQGKVVAARDSITLKKQNFGKLIEEAKELHGQHDELDRLHSDFNELIG